MLQAFIYGVVLAFGLIIPLGVQNIFIFNQGVTQKHLLHAMPSVITAFICDSILILLSVLGISAIVLTIPWLEKVIFILGFCFLVYMGYSMWKANLRPLRIGEKPLSAKKQIIFSMSVSLLNPHALIDTVSVIGTNSLNFSGHEKWAYTSACISVSMIWFFSLSVAGHCLNKVDKNGSWQKVVNKISALIIFSVAIYIGFQIFR